MAFDLKAARKSRADIQHKKVTIWGNELSVGYVPSRLTPKLLRQMSATQSHITSEDPETALAASEAAVSALVNSFLSVVVEWDMTSGGEPIPLTEEGLEDVELEILSEILKQLREEQVPN